MTLLAGPTQAFTLDDVDLFDLVGSLRLDRVQTVALLERARDPERITPPAFPISALPCGATAAVELRRPIHLLADLLTMAEYAQRPLDKISVCYVGDGEADIARSLLLAGSQLGMDIRIAAPASMWPSDNAITTAQDLAAGSCARLLITPDARQAVRRAMFVVVGAWADGSVLEGDGTAPGAYLVTEDFLSTSGVAATRTLFEAAAGPAPTAPRSLQSLQARNRRRVMGAVLNGWLAH